MQRLLAVRQCIGIDAGMSGTIIRAFRFHTEGESAKTWLFQAQTIVNSVSISDTERIDNLDAISRLVMKEGSTGVVEI